MKLKKKKKKKIIPIDIITELPVKDLGKLLSQSPNRVAHIHIVILLLFLLFARLGTSLHRSRELSVQAHALIHPRNPNPTPRPSLPVIPQNNEAFGIPRTRVTEELRESGNFRRTDEKSHGTVKFSENEIFGVWKR
jgi:hypothetical protein